MTRGDEGRGPWFTRTRWAQVVIAWAAAAIYYLLTVTGEIGRTSSVLVSALPAALVLAVFWWRPVLAIVLSVMGVTLTAWFATHGEAVQSVAAQASAAVAVLGAAVDDDRRVRDLGKLFTGFVAVAATVFIISRTPPHGSPDLALMLPFLVLLLGPWFLASVLRRNSVLARDLTDSARSREAAERDVVLAVERNRLARDVHDVVAHSLAVVIAQADGARFAAASRPETVGPALDAIADTARRALGDVRAVLHDLRSSSEGASPGPDDLRSLVNGVRGLGVEVEEVMWGDPAPLGREAGLALYRIAQEALTNAMRHGDRSEPIGVEVDWGTTQVLLVVTNALDGDEPPTTEWAGHGVAGMVERATDAGGECAAGPGSNGRYRVRVALPIALPATTAPPRTPRAPLSRPAMDTRAS